MRSKITTASFIAGLIYCLVAFKTTTTNDVDYFEKNKSELKINDLNDLSDFNILKDDLNKNEVFLCGETHWVSINDKLKFKFFKYLYLNANVRYYLMEGPHSYASILNERLNADTLKPAWKKDEFFWYMYNFNKTLPPDQKIKFLGMDIERLEWGSAVPALKKLLHENQKPPVSISNIIDKIDSVSVLFDSIKNWDYSPVDQHVKTLSYALQVELKKHEADFKTYLGEKYFDFSIIAENLINNYDAHWGESGQLNNQSEIHKRENSMFYNYLKFYPTLKGKVFGQFGSMHVCQDTSGIIRTDSSTGIWHNPYTFAFVLNNSSDSPIKGKVLSIGYDYKKCLSSQKNRAYYPEGDPCESILTKNDEDIFITHAKSNFTLYKLNNENTPLKKLSESFQYILLIQDQKQLIFDY